MRAVPVRQAFEPPGHADERVIGLDPGAGVGDPELGRAHHDVLDCAGAREQRHLARDRVDTWRFHAECRTNCANGLPRTHADMHSDPDCAQVGELARRMRRQSFEAALLNKRGDRLLVQ